MWMPSPTKFVNRFNAAGINKSSDLSLSWQAFANQLKRPCSIWSGSRIHNKPRKVWLLVGKAQLAGCLKVYVGGPLDKNAGMQ